MPYIWFFGSRNPFLRRYRYCHLFSRFLGHPVQKKIQINQNRDLIPVFYLEIQCCTISKNRFLFLLLNSILSPFYVLPVHNGVLNKYIWSLNSKNFLTLLFWIEKKGFEKKIRRWLFSFPIFFTQRIIWFPLKGVFAKNERRYRLTAKNKRF